MTGNKWRFGAEMWDGTERWPRWRKLAKRQAHRLDRRNARKAIAEE